MSTMKELEVAFKITLTSCKVNNRALKIKNHEQHELAKYVDRSNLEKQMLVQECKSIVLTVVRLSLKSPLWDRSSLKP